MGWLERLFGTEHSEQGKSSAQQATATVESNAAQYQGEIPPERMGLNGEYDQSGLAKRVALAYDGDDQLKGIETLYVAQSGSTVVLKGKVPNQDLLNRMVSVARGVHGATTVDTNEVTVGA